MVTKKYQRSKGSQFEYAVKDTLEYIYLKEDFMKYTVYLTKEIGYQKQYDIVVRYEGQDIIAIECKKHRSISWNEAKKYFLKLEEKAKDIPYKMLIFQSNRQPVLIMSRDDSGQIFVKEFKDVYEIDVRRYSLRNIVKS